MSSTEEETKAMIERVDEEAENLRADGKELEALSLMEKGLVLRHSLYGKDGEKLWDACQKMAELCNMLAMKILNGGDFSLSLELLKKAELLSERDQASNNQPHQPTHPQSSLMLWLLLLLLQLSTAR